MVAAGFRVLGPGALLNADLFALETASRRGDGIYAYFSQPIYVGYGLIVVGRGVYRQNLNLMALGAWLTVLLIAVETRAEDYAWGRNRSRELELAAPGAPSPID